MKKLYTLFCFIFPSILLAQEPCQLLKNIQTGYEFSELAFYESLTVAGDRLFFSGATCSESPEVYTILAGEDSVYLPRNVWPEAGDGWCGTDPTWYFNRAGKLTAVDDNIFFTITHPDYGWEIWTSDGSTAGTRLIRDIFEGTASSQPTELTAFAGELWFAATSGTHGTELWHSDGTPDGTEMVLDIAMGIDSASPANLAVLDAELFFTADVPGEGHWLWKTDGTASGTVQYLSLATAGAPDFVPVELYSAGNQFFLVMRNDVTDVADLYLVDLSAGNVVFLHSFHSSFDVPNHNPHEFVAAAGTTFFVANTLDHGFEVWKTDGTPTGTELVKEVNPGSEPGYPMYLTEFDGLLYFRGYTGSASLLFQSDGTEAGTVAATFSPQTPQNISSLLAWDGHLYFASGSSEIWRTDGAVAEQAIAGLTNVFDLRPVGDALYFFGRKNPEQGVWKWNGTLGDEPEKVRGMGSYDGSSAARNFANMGGENYFWASFDGGDREIWKTDGSEAGTVQVTDFEDNFNTNSALLPILDSLLLFTAFSPDSGTEPWVTNGQPGNQSLIIDVNPGPQIGLSQFAVADSKLGYFTRSGGGLYRTDGTEAGSFQIHPSAKSPREVVEFDGATFFRVFYQGDTWLMRTDGTVAGTELLTLMVEGQVSTSNTIVVFEDQLWLIKEDASNQWGLWKTDGTAQGLELVALLNGPDDYHAHSLMTDGERLFFNANDGIHGSELWISDGTTAGTQMAFDLNPEPGEGSSMSQRTFFNGNMFFMLYADPTYGSELWVTDGTEVGTALFVDILPGPESSSPRNFGDALTDSLVFFSAFTPEHGRELWQTDGTVAGTFMVQDICPGPCSAHPDNFRLLDEQRLLFTAYSPGIGLEPWVYEFSSDTPTSASAGFDELQLLIFPNPAFGETLHVEIPIGLSDHHFEVVDLRGKVLASQTLAEGQPGIHTVSLRGINNGMYLLRMLDGKGRVVSVEKFLVLKN